MAIILPANTLSAGGYEVANSCRFTRGDSPYMHITPSGDGNLKIFTVSFWVKRGNANAGSSGTDRQVIFSNNTNDQIGFHNDTLQFLEDGSNSAITNMKFLDFSAWYHVVMAFDTSQSTNTNRQKVYVNGKQIDQSTGFSTMSYVGQDLEMGFGKGSEKMSVGRSDYDGNRHFDGYLAEFYYINGSMLDHTSFGEFDEDSPTIWKPKEFEGSFGTNGFYLDFEDSANLGNDANGGTDLTEVNLAAADQATDTPTNSFCTLNPLDNYYAGYTFSEGNCKIVTANTPEIYTTSTIWVTAGRWYAEGKVINASGAEILGIASNVAHSNSDTNHLGEKANNWGLYNGGGGGTAIIYGDASSDSQTATTGLADFTTNDIMGIYLDLEDNKLYFSKNGTLYSSTGLSLTDPASLTVAGNMGAYTFAFGEYGGSAPTWEANFGGCPAFSLSSAVSDDNGYGNFEYSPNITGDGSAKKFYALCTKNLAEFG